MKQFFTNVKTNAVELWNDDQGAEGLEKILILAAIALPLLAVLLFFSGAIREWVQTNWDSVEGNSNTNNNVGDDPF